MSSPAPWSASVQGSFARESTAKRWPIILTSVIDNVHTEGNASQNAKKLSQGKALIEAIGGLKYELLHDRALTPIPDDGEANVDIYNDELTRLQSLNQATWFSGPWLYIECYMYRRLRYLFLQQSEWIAHDPFLKSKLDTFKSSQSAVLQLAYATEELCKAPSRDLKVLEAQFYEMAQANLWGNASDLSLLTNLTHDDIVKLQSGAAADKAEFILRNDLAPAWQHLSSLKGGRIDIVLDNAGFELYTDLALADWLLSTPFCSQVIFHPKTIPWFVSDVLPADFKQIFQLLASNDFFADLASHSTEQTEALENCAIRWNKHLEEGRFALSVSLDTPLGATTGAKADYWCNSYGFDKLVGTALLEELKQSHLVIFKGDLNYRKLTADLQWDAATPFDEALGTLAGHLDLLSLRTCKADVVVGLPKGRAEELDQKAPGWRGSGEYAVISFSRRSL